MTPTSFCVSRPRKLGTLLVVTLLASGCGIDKQTAPSLIGPSGHALDLVVTATPDSLVQDGVSTATIQVVARGADGKPVPGLQVVLTGASNNTTLVRSVSFTAPSIATNADGVAITQLIAPPPPATLPWPSSDPEITVFATPVGGNFANQAPRGATVRLLAPEGTPLANVGPNAKIVANPPVVKFGGSVHFDASLTTDEGGLACSTRCQYVWNFGDGSDNQRGITMDHVFETPGDYTVTLIVTDPNGGSDSTSIVITVLAS